MGENIDDNAEPGGLSCAAAESMVRVNEEPWDPSRVSEPLDLKVDDVGAGEMSDSRALGSSNFV